MTDLTIGTREWSLWSTTARVVVTDDRVLDEAVADATALLGEVELAASRFRDDSEIRRLPGLLADAPDGVRVSPLLADLLRAALVAAETTDGAVDPTVGRALRELGYDRDISLLDDGGTMRVTVRAVPGWRRVRLVDDLLRMPAGIELDLGASAKAVAADRVAALVTAHLGVGVLVSLGGDIATAGPAPLGGWQVAVQDHADDPATQIALEAGGAVATSSTLRRTWLRDGRTVHHIVDPRTGRSASDHWRTVTVAAATCAYANAASTATVVKGSAGLAWLRDRGLPARLVDHDHRVHLLCGWPADDQRSAA